MPDPAPLQLALDYAAHGWHIFPLSPASKRPLANCDACPDGAHQIDACPCLPAGHWCHGVRAATTNPQRLHDWWHREPRAVPGLAAGPSGLILIDIDTHDTPLPDNLATGLLPGINLAAEPIPADQWNDPARFRDGRDTLTLLARLRHGPGAWPHDPTHQPITATTPSGGRHLWYTAPDTRLRQAIGELAWQVDIKAGWSYGIAPGAHAASGTYHITPTSPQTPGHMPDWLTREVARVATPRQHHPPATAPRATPMPTGRGRSAYLSTVLHRGAARLATLTDGRQRALSALAYQIGGLLDWSGLSEADVIDDLVHAGTTAGLPDRLAHRIATRALTNGQNTPLQPNNSLAIR
jgi:hypothetical protein